MCIIVHDGDTENYKRITMYIAITINITYYLLLLQLLLVLLLLLTITYYCSRLIPLFGSPLFGSPLRGDRIINITTIIVTITITITIKDPPSIGAVQWEEPVAGHESQLVD